MIKLETSWTNQDGWSPNVRMELVGKEGEGTDLPKASPTQPGSQGQPRLGLGLGPGLQPAAWFTYSGWERGVSQMGGVLFVCLYIFLKEDWKHLNVTRFILQNC